MGRLLEMAFASLVSALAVSSCLTPHPSPVPPQPPPVRPVVVWVQTAAGPFEGARVSFGGYSTLTEPDGHVGFNLPESVSHINVAISAAGFELYGVETDLPTGPGGVDLCVCSQAPPPGSPWIALPALTPLQAEFLPRLRVRGLVFERETGEPITLIETSDFNLYARFLADEDIEPVLIDREGFNLLRVWLSYPAIPLIGQLDPFAHEDFYGRLPAFVRQAGAHGLYVEFTAFAGPGWMAHDRQREHWRQTVDALQSLPVLLELANENDVPGNAGLVSDLPRPVGVLASHGSNGAEARPVEPYWDYVTYHTNGAFEEQRKVGHNGWEMGGDIPALTNETSRFPDVGMWAGAPAERRTQLAYDSAAGAALLSAGSCFHSVHGKDSTVFDAAEKAVAQAWIAGAQSVPLACQDGGYEHLSALEGPDDLRVYRRGGDNACLVRIRR